MTVTQPDHGHQLTTKSRIVTMEQRKRPKNGQNGPHASLSCSTPSTKQETSWASAAVKCRRNVCQGMCICCPILHHNRNLLPVHDTCDEHEPLLLIGLHRKRRPLPLHNDAARVLAVTCSRANFFCSTCPAVDCRFHHRTASVTRRQQREFIERPARWTAVGLNVPAQPQPLNPHFRKHQVHWN